jgi:hypothetical protein
MSGHAAMTVVVATTATRQWHLLATTAAMMPPVAGPEGALAVARALLHIPQGLGASLEAAEQWCNDVGHLIIATINTPPHRRLRAHHSHGNPEPSLALSHTPMVARTLVVASPPRPTTSATAWEKMATSPSRAGVRGAATSRMTTALQMPLLRGMLHIPLVL